MTDDKVIGVLKRYDDLIKLILEQKLDEYSDRLSEQPSEEEEAAIQLEAMAQTKQQSEEMEDTADEALGGMSMNEYFRELPASELTEILGYAAVELDRGVPASVVRGLASKEGDEGRYVTEYCLRTIRDTAWTEDELKDDDILFEMEFQKVRACLEVLAEKKDPSAVSYILDRFMSYAQTTEFVADSIAEYLESFPSESVPLMIKILTDNEEEGLTGPCEDLVIILTHIGKANASDEIYSALRTAFRWMKNKIYAVICLADYGDSRAVPMLKSYINRHQDTIERDLFYEIMSAIQNLGGDISDISDPFGDFQKKYDN